LGAIQRKRLEAVRQHRAELAELSERVRGASPQLHDLTYANLWAQWDTIHNVPWLPAHLAALRGRYLVPIRVG
jgi:hypothetical protein